MLSTIMMVFAFGRVIPAILDYQEPCSTELSNDCREGDGGINDVDALVDALVPLIDVARFSSAILPRSLGIVYTFNSLVWQPPRL